jgi:hypothetical protein
MATIKYWDGTAWVLAIVGKQGPQGPTGPTGPQGADNPVVDYLDGGNVANTDVIYDAGSSTTSSWTYTIDAGGATVTF